MSEESISDTLVVGVGSSSVSWNATIGVDPWYVTSNVYESQPLARIQLLPRVLETLELSDCGRIAFLTIDDALLGVVGGDESMLDGFINYARSIRGVEVAVQLLESDGTWRVSFRSRGRVDVSEIAARHGGGGHRNAAGCAIASSPDAIRSELITTFLEILPDEIAAE